MVADMSTWFNFKKHTNAIFSFYKSYPQTHIILCFKCLSPRNSGCHSSHITPLKTPTPTGLHICFSNSSSLGVSDVLANMYVLPWFFVCDWGGVADFPPSLCTQTEFLWDDIWTETSVRPLAALHYHSSDDFPWLASSRTNALPPLQLPPPPHTAAYHINGC